jgi:hypothetical protein
VLTTFPSVNTNIIQSILLLLSLWSCLTTVYEVHHLPEPHQNLYLAMLHGFFLAFFAVLVLADMLPKKLRAYHTVGANYLHLTRILEYRLK